MGRLLLVCAIGGSAGWLGCSLTGSAVWARRLAAAAVTLGAGAALVLVVGLVRVDPSLAYVARHSSTETPLVYRVAGVWGGMEGSLLMWAVMTAGAGWLGTRVARRGAGHLEQGMAAMAALCSTFFFALAAWAEPFATLSAPTGRGDGLTAVLQHPAMIYHPPLLYGGLVLLVVPAGLTCAASARGHLDRTWLDKSAVWLHASWAVLGAGLLAGSRWAYVELGWGGFWAWDPVENAGLIPWLITVAAIHHIRAAKRSSVARRTVAALIGASFVAMIAGVYLTRAGDTGSIHAFASSPAIGRALLVFAVLVAAATVVGVGRVETAVEDRAARRRDRVMGVPVVLAVAVAVVVIVGTFGPSVREALDGRSTIVTTSYYERSLAPVVLVLLAALSTISVQRSARSVVRRGLAVALGLGLAAAVVVAVGARSVVALGVIALGVIAFASSLLLRSASPAPVIAHAGLALMIVGGVASATGSTVERGLGLDSAAAASAELALVALEPGETDRYSFVRVTVVVDGERYEPELRAYRGQALPVAESALRARPLRDTIVSVESLGPDLQSARVIIRERPLAGAVWVGAGLIVVAGLLAWRERHRGAGRGSRGEGSRPTATAAQR